MAHHKSAKKRIKTNYKRQLRNKQYLSRVRTAVKDFRLATADKNIDQEKLQAVFSTAQSLLARAWRRKIIAKNTAARKTKRLHLLLKKVVSP